MSEELHAAGKDVSSIQWHWSCCVSGGLCRGAGDVRDVRAAVSASLGSTATAVAWLEVDGRGGRGRAPLWALRATSPSPWRLSSEQQQQQERTLQSQAGQQALERRRLPAKGMKDLLCFLASQAGCGDVGPASDALHWRF